MSGFAVAGIDNSKHDLGTYYDGSASTGQICIFCHTPHNASLDDAAPLWNHAESTALYTLYDSATLNADQSGMVAGANRVSAMCLSCHDGTVALGSVVNSRTALSDTTTKMGDIVGTKADFGTDLSNDHPIGFDYLAVSSADTEIRAPGLLNIAQLFGDQLECASCHDVHDDTNVPFLLDDNQNSALCLDCHIK